MDNSQAQFKGASICLSPKVSRYVYCTTHPRSAFKKSKGSTPPPLPKSLHLVILASKWNPETGIKIGLRVSLCSISPSCFLKWMWFLLAWVISSSWIIWLFKSWGNDRELEKRIQRGKLHDFHYFGFRVYHYPDNTICSKVHAEEMNRKRRIRMGAFQSTRSLKQVSVWWAWLPSAFCISNKGRAFGILLCAA